MTERAALGGDFAPATPAPLPRPPRVLDVLAGAAVLAAFTAMGLASARVQSFVPGAVAGFLALTVALAIVERRPAVHGAVTRGLVPLARVLLRHMGLLFVPAGVVGVQGLAALPARVALPVAGALVGSTLAGLVAAGAAMRRAR